MLKFHMYTFKVLLKFFEQIFQSLYVSAFLDYYRSTDKFAIMCEKKAHKDSVIARNLLENFFARTLKPLL